MAFTSKSTQRAARRRSLEDDLRKRAQGWDGSAGGFGARDAYDRAIQRRTAFERSSAGNVPAPTGDDAPDENDRAGGTSNAA